MFEDINNSKNGFCAMLGVKVLVFDLFPVFFFHIRSETQEPNDGWGLLWAG